MFSQHQTRANLYRRLAVSQAAGIPLAQAVSRHGGGMLDEVGQLIGEGESAGSAFGALPGITQLEARAIEAGDKAGALPDVFNRLADLHEERLASKRQLIAAMAYPVILLHLAPLAASVPALVRRGGGLGAFVVEGFGTIAFGYLVAAVVYAGIRVARRLPAFEPIELALPLWGKFVKLSEWGNGFRVCGMLYTHGVGVLEATGAAAQASNRELFASAWRTVETHLKAGESLASACAAVPDFPNDALELIHSGETSGQLDTSLKQLEKDYEGRRSMQLKLLIGFAAGATFLLAAGVVAFTVISFYVGHINQALDVLDSR